ncbi:Calx-beta domain-containing protein [Parvularcula oceani]|uniref:Calx-beta domain-containing protein n=1 Tax=Parvularcula oceani TaxID=1247963 RepID=UPI001EE2D076|nr:Calx-beta domain-containing protein [Parvularcula oceani]
MNGRWIRSSGGGRLRARLRFSVMSGTALMSLHACAAHAQDVVSHGYDALGRLISTEWLQGGTSNACDPAKSFRYDAAGNRKEVAVVGGPHLTVENAYTPEGGLLLFAVKRGGKEAPVAANYTISDGSAKHGTNYFGSKTGSIEFTETGRRVIGTDGNDVLIGCDEPNCVIVGLSTKVDGVYADDLTLEIELTDQAPNCVPGGAKTVAIGAIGNTDGAPSFFVDDPRATEGGELIFTVTLDRVSSVEHRVDYETQNHPTVSSDDYTATSGTLTFPVGQTEKEVRVAITQDEIHEGVEYVYLMIGSPTNGAMIGDDHGDGRIADDDPVSVRVGDDSAQEGGSLEFTVSLNRSSSKSHKIDFATSNSTAQAGTDYDAENGTLTFAPGETEKTFAVNVRQDTVYEATEVFNVNLANATNGLGISDSRAIGEIVDDESVPAFRVSDPSVSEGGQLAFEITLSGDSALSHKVNFATANASATADDYDAKSGTITFPPHTSSRNVTVQTREDSVYEGNETVRLNLSSATGGATIADSRGEGQIQNDDPAPKFAVNNPSVTEGGRLRFTITKTGATQRDHHISYATANVSATAGSDYTQRSGSLGFTPTTTSRVVEVPTQPDNNWSEGNETLELRLSNATGGATIADSRGLGTIKQPPNDPPVARNDSVTLTRYQEAYRYVIGNDSDPDGDSLTITSVTQPTNGSVAPSGSGSIWIWAREYGVSTFRYTITDGKGKSDTATVTLTVPPPSGGGGGGGGGGQPPIVLQ